MHPTLEHPSQIMGAEWTGETFFRDLFARAPIACFSVGTDGRVRAANKRALDVVGYQAPEIIGRPVLNLYADTPAGKAKAEEQFLLFRSGAEVRSTELEMRRADGRSVWINLSVNPIIDGRGRLTASCSVVQEIPKPRLSAPPQLQQVHAGPSSTTMLRVTQTGHFRTAQDLLRRFLIKSGSTSYFIRPEEIDWIGAAGNYVELHIGNKSLLMRKTMNALETKLDSRRFLRIHRSAIVNVERIKELRPWHYGDHKIVLFDGTQLTLKRYYSERLAQLVGEPV